VVWLPETSMEYVVPVARVPLCTVYPITCVAVLEIGTVASVKTRLAWPVSGLIAMAAWITATRNRRVHGDYRHWAVDGFPLSLANTPFWSPDATMRFPRSLSSGPRFLPLVPRASTGRR